MKRVLRLHENYPANKDALAGKLPEEKPYDTPLGMPGMDRKAERRGPTTRKNCIHCHNIHDAQQRQWRANGTFSLEKLYRYPLPENVGVSIKRDDGRRIERVEEGSAAARAGLRAGDVILRMNGQAITSIADIQWVLHHTPNEDGEAVTVTVKRGGGELRETLGLSKGWREIDFSWRGSIWSLRPRIAAWTVDVGEEKRRELGLSEGQEALLVKWINKGVPAGKAARRGGLREGDVIVGLEGGPLRKDQREFQLHVRLSYEPGDTLPLTVRRDGERHELKIPLVEEE